MNKFMDAAIKKITETVGIFEPDEEFYYHLNMFVIKNIVPKLRDRRLRMLDCRASKNLCVRCVRGALQTFFHATPLQTVRSPVCSVARQTFIQAASFVWFPPIVLSPRSMKFEAFGVTRRRSAFTSSFENVSISTSWTRLAGAPPLVPGWGALPTGVAARRGA